MGRGIRLCKEGVAKDDGPGLDKVSRGKRDRSNDPAAWEDSAESGESGVGRGGERRWAETWDPGCRKTRAELQRLKSF